ncbi:MAG TPA: 6-phosphogluconolactonase [Methylomirabilota bacterium]|nr:6-phosphogluconolactonase [Methylomirabilota bacterium]
MNVSVHPTSDAANVKAAELFAQWLTTPGVRNVMLATGNTPLELYRLISERRPSLGHLNVFALDEYVGVRLDHPRNCANVLRRTAIAPWGVPAKHFFSVSSVEADALDSVQAHERRIAEAGGIDAIVLGLGQNGHLGFNEPGIVEDSVAHVQHLDTISIEANRKWFEGEYAPSRGVTVGLKTILSAQRILIMAYGMHKTAAVKAMLEGPRTIDCPGSLLQGHGNVNVFLDERAAAGLTRK